MSSVHIYLIRHGETLSRDRLAYPDASEVCLSKFGKFQARSVGKRLKRLLPARVLASPFPRAYDTAQIALPNARIVTDERLSEYAPTKTATGSEYKEWKKKVMDNFVFIPPSGESMEMAWMRGRNVLVEAGRGNDNTILVFGHALSFGAFLKREFGMNHFPVLEECSITHIIYDSVENTFELKKLNSRTWNIHIFCARLWRKMKMMKVKS